jgi:hypothetical protein
LPTIQQQYCLINIKGKLWVLDMRKLETRTSEGRASALVLSNRTDGSLMIMRALEAQFPAADSLSIVKKFYVSPNTTCFDGVEFNPLGASPNYLNLWVGPTIIPKAGEWKLIQSFLRNVICGGDDECYQYLLRYIAHALQKPEEKPGVMIILMGGQGTGKGTLGRILQKIWSATYLQVNNVDTVTGNFNAALERSFMVFMDEALFVGDRRAADALKSLVTEPLIHVNEKHQPARQTRSYHRFIAATNANHFKITERDDRRDFTLRVAAIHKDDHAYWNAVRYEIFNGGVAAMVHDLYEMDLSEFNVRAKPATKELLEQKLFSLGPIERWWHDFLDSGGVEKEDSFLFSHENRNSEWPEFLSTDAAIDGIMHTAGGKIHQKPSANDVVKALMKICPSIIKGQRKVDGKRRRGLVIPSLQQARAEFGQYIGGAVDWLEDEI